MEDISLIDVKCCWGNYAFEYVYSPAVGNSGGILCVWEKSAFKKNNLTISDYFVMIGGSWLCSGVNLLIISMYSPQEYAEKKILWDYFVHVISKWDGEVIVMGDFNEVRFKNERFESLFHAHGADAFNRFILQANLQEIPLRGCSFTWCHRSAKKMSKLDWFLMSEGLLGVNPNFSTLMLDRYLSDHRPIMLRDSSHDYGPIPFRILAIEGDENTKFYRGSLNKKRNKLGIRGVLKDGMWIDNPVVVKKEFLEHFSTRFKQPRRIRPVINIDFPCTISELKKNELEGDISYKEIKRAVWDCGVDKSPGPDGVTFGFIRRYWSLIEKD
nr:RNA-directed DNA polymerase, eukaryota [Tanacetum cinerariifolium]